MLILSGLFGLAVIGVVLRFVVHQDAPPEGIRESRDDSAAGSSFPIEDIYDDGSGVRDRDPIVFWHLGSLDADGEMDIALRICCLFQDAEIVDFDLPDGHAERVLLVQAGAILPDRVCEPIAPIPRIPQ